MKKSILRIVSMVLSIALLAGCINVGAFTAQTSRTITLSGSVSGITDAKIIADYAGDFLSDGEKAVLHCTALVGNEHYVTAPTDDDKADLIIINKEEKTVEVKNFTDSEGYVWKPAKVQLVYGTAYDDITLDANGKGSFECDSNTYSIEVTYVVSVEIESGLFQTLVNAPMYLANGIVNMNAVAALAGDMETLAEYTETLYSLTETGGGLLENECEAAIIALRNDCLANSTATEKKLKINTLIDEYNAAENKTEYMIENGKAFKEAFELYYNNLNTCAVDSQWENMIWIANYMGWTDKAKALETALGILKGLNNNAATINSANWEVLNQTLVKTTATTAELAALNSAVLDLAVNGEIAHDTELAELSEYPAASVTLKQGVDQYNVTFKVQANVVAGVDSSVLTPVMSAETITLTFDKGTSFETIKDAVEEDGIVDRAIAAWAAGEEAKYDIYTSNYTVTCEYPETLTQDGTYTILFTPVDFSLDFCGELMSVPYGYVQTLETYAAVNGDTSKSYDYTVNGSAMREGVTYRVVGDTVVTRKEGEATAKVRLPEVVANSYKPGAGLTADAKNILFASAIKGDYLYFRTPSDKLELVELTNVSATTYKVTAAELASGLTSGAVWAATTGYAVDANGQKIAVEVGGQSVTEFAFESGIATFDCSNENFREVKVNYELVVSDVETSVVDDYINLPKTLVDEAKAQKDLLSAVVGDSMYENLGTVNAKYNLIFAVISEEMGFTPESVAAAKKMKESCVDQVNKSFYLYDYITSYRNEGGLAWLYAEGNTEKMQEQIIALAEALGVIAKDAAFPVLLAEVGYSEYGDKVDDIVAKLDTVVEKITVLNVNPYIDRTSDYLPALVTAIENATGDVKDFGTGNELVLSTVLGAVTSGVKKVTVNVGVINSAGEPDAANQYSESLTFPLEYVLTNTDAKAINDLIATLKSKLTIDTALYDIKVIGTIPSAGDTITANVDVTITYQPKSYTVKIEGENDVTIKADNAKITLPVCTIAGSKYVYTINGEQYAQGASVTFTADKLKTLFGDGTLTITRETIVVAREDIINFANELNAALAPAGINVSALENADGKIVLVLNINASAVQANQSKLTTAASDMAQKVMAYDYVGIGSKAFWDGSVLSVQTIIDAVTNSDFGFEKLCAAIDANGNFTAMKLDGYKVISNAGVLGAEMVGTSVELDAPETTYPLYVTVSGGAETLKTLDETLTKVMPYVNLQCGKEHIGVTINLPEPVYAVYLAQMLLTERAELADVTAMDHEEALKYEISLISDLLKDENFTIETIEATLAKAGQNFDLSKYENVFDIAVKLARYIIDNFELYGTQYIGTFNYAIRSALVNAGVPETLLGFIKEAQTDSEGIYVNAYAYFANLNEEREALVFDYNAAGYLNKYYATSDLEAVLGNLGNNAVVVLLSDVVFDKAVAINNNVFINLNGFTINGDMTANGNVRIVDSLASTECGSVNGNLTGNFVVTGGSYSCDVTSMLPKGYEVSETGYVSSAIYTVAEENGNVTINLSADFLNKELYPAVSTDILSNTSALLDTPVLVDVAFDVALNMFTKAQMTVDGNELYNIEVLDAVGYLDSTKTDLANTALDFINWPALTNLFNTMVTDVCDFAALKTAIEAGEAVASYEYNTKAWEISPLKVENGYITLDVFSGTVEKSGTVSIVVVGTEEEKAELAELCESLDETVTVNHLYLNVTDVTFNGGKSFNLEYDASANIEVDFSSEHDYAALIGTAVAYAMPDGTAKTNLVNALGVYFENGDITELAKALDNTTVAQFIAAVKALSSTTCEAMLTKLGLTSDDVVALEAVYGDLIDIAGVTLAKLNITGPDSKLSAIKVADAEYKYAFVRENVKGYNVDIAFTLTLFSEAGDIVIEEPVIDLNESSAIVAGWEVSGGVIFADITPNGWTTEDVTHIIFEAPAAEEIVVTVLDREGNEKTTGLICTGDTVKVVATNAKGSAEAEYTIIIMGDTNADGVANIGDAYAIAQHYTGVKTLDKYSLLAADLNCDGAINVGDTYKIAIKYTSWDDNSYDSDLENK